jgi:hypothetical protein
MITSGCGDDGGTGDGGTDTGMASDTGMTGDTGMAGDTGTMGDTGMMGDTGAGEMASVRVLHLSPDAPNVDVFVGDAADAVVSDLAFPDGTDYLMVPVGTYTFNVRVAGMPATDPVLTFADVALTADQQLTAVAWDEVAMLSGLAVNNDSDGLDAANIRLTAIHAAGGVGEVDIWNIPESGDPAPLWENLATGAVGDAVDVPAGAYTVGIDVDDDATPDLTFDLPDLAAGTVANAYAVNDGDDVFLIAQLPDGATARIDPNP